MTSITDGLSPLTPEEIAQFIDTGEVSGEVYERCYEFYLRNGDMPYGTAKARDGDPYQWVLERLAQIYTE